MIPSENMNSLAIGAGVRKCGAGGNRVQRISGYIREDQGEHLCGGGQKGQTTSFDLGEVLSDYIDLMDIGTRLEEQLCGPLLLGQRHRLYREGQQGRASPREQDNNQVPLGETLEEGKHLEGCLYPGPIRNGVARLDDPDSGYPRS